MGSGDTYDMGITGIDPAAAPRVALLYQAVPPPSIGGLRKDPKPGGYSDSGADIAFALSRAGIDVATPRAHPDPDDACAWVFPDTADGIQAARAAGADVLWANTVLFAGHPLEAHMGDCWIVGQVPARQQAVDDKFATNRLLRGDGLPVAPSLLVAQAPGAGVTALTDLTAAALDASGLAFPLVVKPVRGRGSQGVARVADLPALVRAATALFDGGRFGAVAMVEQYLAGAELTITVLPHAAGRPGAGAARAPRVLPPVLRFNHQDGIAPYNGTVAVTANSVALDAAQSAQAPVQAIMRACATACERIGALAPVRIDCRADGSGDYRIFDVNMKPNMTGAGRPGRDDQDSLCVLAARAAGWTYADLLRAMLAGAWRV